MQRVLMVIRKYSNKTFFHVSFIAAHSQLPAACGPGAAGPCRSAAGRDFCFYCTQKNMERQEKPKALSKLTAVIAFPRAL